MEGKYRPTLFLSVNLRAKDNSMEQRCRHFDAGCIFDTFLGAIANLRKANRSFVMSVRPFVSPHETTRQLQYFFPRNSHR